jgi:hypothetical protein
MTKMVREHDQREGVALFSKRHCGASFPRFAMLRIKEAVTFGLALTTKIQNKL